MRNMFRDMVTWYFSRSALPYWCLLLLDIVVVFLSGMFTYWLFNRTGVMFDERFNVLYTVSVFSLLSILGARVFRTYSGVVRYSSFVDLVNVAYANIVSLAMAFIVMWTARYFDIRELTALDVSQTITMFVVATLVMAGMRVVVKSLYDVVLCSHRGTRVLIYGALTGGVGLAKYINTLNPRKYILCGFISHDNNAGHFMLMGQKVYNVNDDLKSIIQCEGIKAVLVSPQRSDDFRRNQHIQDLLICAGVKIFIAQQAKEVEVKNGVLADDSVSGMQIHEVSVEDLLPRDEITVDLKSVSELLEGKRVLVTGAAGSIGSEIVRQVASFKPADMILIDQAETPQHDIRLMMARDYPDICAETIVTSICNETHMEQIFSQFHPDYVFHAAAYKHVPMMENNPSEAVLNNIRGTKILADLSVKYGVRKFVMISTDKAVNPTNVMGCSKRICEIYVQSLDRKLKLEAMTKKKAERDDYTQFVTTRFGNVLGSNGSVIPLFREQIKNGGPVTVTDERIVRFFMLIPEACRLVLEAGTKGMGGEIFVFDMGQPVKIADLAKRMIALSGAKNVQIKFTGLREGEKLYEEVLNELEGTKPTFHEKIRIAQVREYEYDDVNAVIGELIQISRDYDNMATVRKMKEIVPEYKSNNSVYEQLDK